MDVRENDEFKEEKILRTKGRGRYKQYLVKWLHWATKLNSWVNAAYMKGYPWLYITIIIIVIWNLYKKKINMKFLKHVLLYIVFIDSNQRKKHIHCEGMESIILKVID